MFRLRIALMAVEIAISELRYLRGQTVEDVFSTERAEFADGVEELVALSLVIRRALGRREQAALECAQIKREGK